MIVSLSPDSLGHSPHISDLFPLRRGLMITPVSLPRHTLLSFQLLITHCFHLFFLTLFQLVYQVYPQAYLSLLSLVQLWLLAHTIEFILLFQSWQCCSIPLLPSTDLMIGPYMHSEVNFLFHSCDSYLLLLPQSH